MAKAKTPAPVDEKEYWLSGNTWEGFSVIDKHGCSTTWESFTYSQNYADCFLELCNEGHVDDDWDELDRLTRERLKQKGLKE